jgi:hypothetical protein
MKIRTLRGYLTDTNIHRLIVDDGRTTHGYVIKEFYVWPDGGGADGVYATLGTQYDMLSGGRADDNRQIAWSGSTWSSTGTPTTGSWGIVDPDHVVNTDLWIRANTTENTNYMVIMEPIILTEDQAILALIKERSQDDLR